MLCLRVAFYLFACTLAAGAAESEVGLYRFGGHGQILIQNSEAARPLALGVRNASGEWVASHPVAFVLDQAEAGLLVSASDTVECSGATCSGRTDSGGLASVRFVAAAITAPFRQYTVSASSGADSVKFNLTVVHDADVLVIEPVKPEPGQAVEAVQSMTTRGAVQYRFRASAWGRTVPLPNVALQAGTSVKSSLSAGCLGQVVLSDDTGLASCDISANNYLGSTTLYVSLGAGYAELQLPLSVIPASEAPALLEPLGSGHIRVPLGGSVELRALVADPQGKPLAGIPVRFERYSQAMDDVAFTEAEAVTDASGIARVTARLGNTLGTHRVSVRAGSSSAMFYLEAVAGSGVGSSFAAEDVRNGANHERQTRTVGWQPQPFVAPCQVLTIMGIAGGQGASAVMAANPLTAVPTWRNLAGVQVTVGGKAAALFSAGKWNGRDQITLQVPCDLAPGEPADITVVVGEESATMRDVPVVAAAPGVFTILSGDGAGHAVMVGEDGTYVSAQNRARRGGTYTMYATGLGEVEPAARTGAAGVGDQGTKNRVVVGLRGRGLQPLRAEYAKGLTGVYAVTFQIPEDIDTGARVPLDVSVVVGEERMLSAGTWVAIE